MKKNPFTYSVIFLLLCILLKADDFQQWISTRSGLPDLITQDNLRVKFHADNISSWHLQENDPDTGSAVLQCGPLLQQTDLLKTTVSGYGTISFFWKLNTACPDDQIVLLINDIPVETITGATSRKQVRISLFDDDVYTLKWAVTSFGDSPTIAYLDHLRIITSDFPVEGPVTLTADGTTADFLISTSLPWNAVIQSGQEWLTLTQQQKTGHLICTAEKNLSSVSRTAQILITLNEEEQGISVARSIQLTQEGKTISHTVHPPPITR